MILIISQTSDLSTIDVIKWLVYYKIPFIRVNREDKYEIDLVEISKEKRHSIRLKNVSNGVVIDFNSVSGYWYRRGEINLILPSGSQIESNYIRDTIIGFLKQENKKIAEFLYDYLSQLNKINEYKYRDLNKLIVLKKANNLGLKIPNTYVTPNPSLINSTIDQKYISKCISDPFKIKMKKGYFTTYTEEITLSSYNKNYFSSLVQTNVIKEADIRIFYLFGKFYSMAILSQSENQTRIDFRKYSSKNPNRKIPFKLPLKIEIKLDALMKELELESGSIDLILDKNKEFTFLEVNPIGQFGMTSYPCNYFIEREIALYLKAFYQFEYPLGDGK